MQPWIHKLGQKKTTTSLVGLFVVVFLFTFLVLPAKAAGECETFYDINSCQAQATCSWDEQSSSCKSDTLGVRAVDQNIALSGTDIRLIIVKIIRVILSFLGVLALSLVLYAGFTIMTSGGNEEKVIRGKKILINAVIGLIIILSALAIVQFIINALTQRYDQMPGGGAPPGVPTFSGSGSLGEIIKDHYPFRDAIDVPRNTSIIVTFGIPVEPSSLIANTNRTCWADNGLEPTTNCLDKAGDPVTTETDPADIVDPYYGDCVDLNNDNVIDRQTECDQLIVENVKIDQADNVDVVTFDDAGVGVPAVALTTYEQDREAYTFVFRPQEYLGNSLEPVKYAVDLRSGILQKDSDESVFAGQFSSHYYWNFWTSTELDLDPPYVTSVWPRDKNKNSDPVPKNTIVQINFSEAMDPTSVQGILTPGSGGFDNILLNTEINGVESAVTGTWRIANGYRTVEFVSDKPCGLNSCGQMMYCLEVDCTGADSDKCVKDYGAIIRTAEWTGNQEALYEAKPFTGANDASFNGLDKLNDGPDHLNKPPEPPLASIKVIDTGELLADNYWWNFVVKNEVDRSTPYVEQILPGVDAEDVSEKAPLKILFNKLMWYKSLSVIRLVEYPYHVCAFAAFITSTPPEDVTCSQEERLDNPWFAFYGGKTDDDKSDIEVKHRLFGPNNLDLYYFPVIPSSVQSLTQNCLYPGRGPWEVEPGTESETSDCQVTYDDNGKVVAQVGCVGVSATVSTTDTGCVYTSEFITDNADPLLLKPDVDACQDYLGSNDVSPSKYQGL